MADSIAARLTMVESQVRVADVTDVRIHDAMRAIAREPLLPAEKAHLAYVDIEPEYAPGRFLLKPRDVGKLLQALAPQAGERALAIAAPYAAQVLAHMGLSVTRHDDADLSAVPGANYHVIVCEGAVARAPEAWLAALDLGGRLGVVERDGPVGKAVVYVRDKDGIGRRQVFDATPPVLAGFRPQHGFAL